MEAKQKKTVVIGVSPNPNRYAYLASNMLDDHGHEVVPLGIRKGQILGKDIIDLRTKPRIEETDTITMYINPLHQKEWYDYLLSLNPIRIIFNPGTENPELTRLAHQKGIHTENACTLVMLSTGQY